MSCPAFENNVVTYLKVTEIAEKKIAEMIAKREKFTTGIRISIRKQGCSGMKYKIEYADQTNISKTDDLFILQNGLYIFIDIALSIFFFGTTMDYVQDVKKSGFVFQNPNESGKCGCGESFYV